MRLALRPGLSWCICTGKAVFLDLERDRYFCLPEQLDPLFLRWVSGDTLASEDQGRLVASGITQAGEGGPARAAEFMPACETLRSPMAAACRSPTSSPPLRGKSVPAVP